MTKRQWRLQPDRDPDDTRDYVLSVRMSKAETDELNRLIALMQIDGSHLVRLLIHERLTEEEAVAA